LAENARLIDELAEAVIDGTPVDWAAVTAGAPAGRFVDHFRVVAALADVHRTGPHSTDGPFRRPTPGPSVPAIWGHLRILERIGRGAFGDVYRAWDSRLDREVALKLIHAELERGDGPPSSIIREGRLLARVRHANVATIYGAEQIGDRVGLWMELVCGRTLEESLLAGSSFTPDRVIQIGVELASAVAAVHAAGLLHRDVKAQNVMQADDGRIVLTDFGTGREFLDERADLAGTPLYLAPEVLSGQPASVHSDVYSLGVVLYRLLTGSYPVQGQTVDDVRRAHQTGGRIDLRTARPDVPAPLARVIEKAIDPVPDRRYPSADSLHGDLERLARRPRGRWLGYVAAAALGIALVSAARVFIVGELARSRVVLPVNEALTIAVLPFKNLSTAPEDQLVADGLTWEITHRLGATDGLTVRAAAVSLGSRERNADLRAVGRDLNVNLVLTGSVLVSGGRLRVSAELVRVADLTTVWSDVFIGKGDVTAHEALALSIVNRLRLNVGQGQRRYRLDQDVEPTFYKAEGLLAKRNTDNAGRAAQLFEQVIVRDPEYAPAWAGLASAIGAFSRATQGETLPPQNPRMDQAALESIRLDPLLAEAHAAMGSLHARDREWRDAETEFKSALALNPSLTTAYTEFALWVLLPMGRQDEAVRVLEDGLAAAPQSLDVRRVLALAQVETGLYEKAIDNARAVLEVDSTFPYAKVWLGRALVLSGLERGLPDRVSEAQAIFENDPKGFGYLGYLYAMTGRRREAEELAAKHPELPRGQMLIYAGLGDKDRAFEALERLAGMNSWRAAEWMHRPEMVLLRGDPRLDALKSRLGLPR
jgi:serine/threonine-protein kinase